METIHQKTRRMAAQLVVGLVILTIGTIIAWLRG